jgi:hypothetical protein
MALTVKALIEKNKSAYKKNFYIESIYISRVLITKALKQIIQEEKIVVKDTKLKLNDGIRLLKDRYDASPLFARKLKRSVYNSICDFNADHKSLSKELKYRFPEVKLRNTAKKGISIIINLNTALIRLRSNKVSKA